MVNSVITKNITKFKSVLVSISFMMPLEAKYASKNALLANVLDKKTMNYSCEKEIKRKLANAYASNVGISVTKTENSFVIRFEMESVKSKKAIEEALEVLYEIMFNPYISVEGTFDSRIFENEKIHLLQKLKEEKDDKKSYALRGLEKIMYEDAYSESLNGREEYILTETARSLYEYYLQFLKEAKVILTIAGNISEYVTLSTDIHKFLEEKLGRKLEPFTIQDRTKKLINTEIRFEKEEQRVLQSVLALGAKIYNTTKEDTYKIMVYNQILGGNPASKLFQNVREKASLAYFAKSKYDRQQEAIYMLCGIEPCNFEKAKDIVIKQIDDIKAGKVDEQEFNAAKNILLGALIEEKDKKESILIRSFSNSLYFGDNVEIEEMIDEINKVTMEDVFDIAQKVIMDAIFLVGGVADDTK